MDIAGQIAEALSGNSNEVITSVIAMLPIAELRGAIPWAMTLGDLPWQEAVLFAVIGNMIPIPFILLLLGPVSSFLRKWKLFDRFFNWLFARTRKRGKSIERFKALGLILFVGIPLPVTGAWTGSVAAFLFGIRFIPSMIFIFIGVCMSATIVTFMTIAIMSAAAAIG